MSPLNGPFHVHAHSILQFSAARRGPRALQPLFSKAVRSSAVRGSQLILLLLLLLLLLPVSGFASRLRSRFQVRGHSFPFRFPFALKGLLHRRQRRKRRVPVRPRPRPPTRTRPRSQAPNPSHRESLERSRGLNETIRPGDNQEATRAEAPCVSGDGCYDAARFSRFSSFSHSPRCARISIFHSLP